MWNRRHFISKSTLTFGSLTAGSTIKTFPDLYSSLYIGKGPVISKFSIFPAGGSFYRFIGPNAYDDKPKGVTGNPRKILVVELSDGTLGIGTIGYRPLTDEVISSTKSLLGQDVLSLYRWNDHRIMGPAQDFAPFAYDANYAWVESAILDAIGHVMQMPVFRLFRDAVREAVDPYDGTLYFADVAHDTDATIIGEIGKGIKEDGYRAIKIKLGRPDKWMPGEAGVERDIEAFIALREAVGNNFNLMADANNGYRDKIDWAIKLMKACAPYDMYFMEELIPDDIRQYQDLRESLAKENLFIPFAEGESIWQSDMLSTFENYCQSGVFHFIQPDMPTCGFSNILRVAKMAEQYPHVKLIPHVWQSEMGLIMSAHLAKIQSNIPFVEDSRYQEHALHNTGSQFIQGQWILSEEPGWGVSLVPGYAEYVDGPTIEISI